MSHRKPEDQRRQIPAWLLGLIIAAVLFIVGFFVFIALGFGDDPVIGQVILVPNALVPNALAPVYGHFAARKDHGIRICSRVMSKTRSGVRRVELQPKRQAGGNECRPANR